MQIQFDSAQVVRIAWHALNGNATKVDATSLSLSYDEFWLHASPTAALFAEPSLLVTVLSALPEVGADGEAVLSALHGLLKAHRRNCLLFWQFGLAVAIDSWEVITEEIDSSEVTADEAEGLLLCLKRKVQLIEDCIRLAEPFAKELYSAAQLLSMLRISAATPDDPAVQRKCSPKRVQFVFDLLRSSVEADAHSRSHLHGHNELSSLTAAPRCYFDFDGVHSALEVRGHIGVRSSSNHRCALHRYAMPCCMRALRGHIAYALIRTIGTEAVAPSALRCAALLRLRTVPRLASPRLASPRIDCRAFALLRRSSRSPIVCAAHSAESLLCNPSMRSQSAR